MSIFASSRYFCTMDSMKETVLNLFIPRYQNDFYPKLLRKSVVGTVTVIVLAANVATTGLGGTIFAGSVSGARLVELTNQERVSAGLNELTSDPRLVAAAYAKAQHIFEHQYWSHYGPNGETPWQFITTAGYPYVYAGENLAKGFSSSEAVHSAWMASQTHRENIISGNYDSIGIAVSSGTLLGSEVVLVVQMFGSSSESGLPVVTQQPEYSSYSGVVHPNSHETVTVTIEYPESAVKLSDPEFFMYGIASGSVDSIIVKDNDDEREREISDEGVWDYRPEDRWEEGHHTVTVWDNEKRASDSVTFEMDTIAPVIDKSSLEVTRNEKGNVVTIAIIVDDTAVEVLFVAGDFSTQLLKDDGRGLYVGTIADGQCSSQEAMIVAIDDVGNMSELDVSQDVLGQLIHSDAAAEGFVVVESVGLTKTVTRGVVFFVALLLIIDVMYLSRLNIIHTRGKTVFPMALWIMVMVIGLLVGPGGTIL